MKFKDLDLKRKIRLPGWDANYWFKYDESDGFYIGADGKKFGLSYSFSILNSDWEYADKLPPPLPKTKTKRYWLWDLEGGYIFKSEIYLDDDGLCTTGYTFIDKVKMLKKHDNEFIDVGVKNG